MFRRSTAGEASTGEIESSPEKMDRAHFSDEAGAKDGDDSGGLQQNVPESLHVFRVICLVRVVLLKWDGLSYLNRHRPDVHRGGKRIECGHDLQVEVCDGHR